MTERKGSIATLKSKARVSYRISTALYFGLMATLMAETWWLNPPQGSLASISLIQLLPLLLPVVGLVKRSPQAASWLCFILCFYFISGVLDAWFRPEQPQGWLITGFSSLLFISAMMFIRWQAKAINLQQSPQFQQ